MNQTILNIISAIKDNPKCLQINFDDASWRAKVPSEAGWYLIITNTPIEILRNVGSPKYKAHINIPKTIDATLLLREIGFAILPKREDEDYVVYNGEARNLKARAREHESGHEKTFCLGLSNYISLRSYRWGFCYLSASSCTDQIKNEINDKLLRLAIEQGWRTYNGWPILCKR